MTVSVKNGWLALTFVLLAMVFTTRVDAAQQYPGNGQWEPGPALYDAGEPQAEWIIMSDGVRLSAAVVCPVEKGTQVPAEGSFPVVLSVTPYAKDLPVHVESAGLPSSGPGMLVPRGYIRVTVDVRGTGSSEGTFNLLGKREQQDYTEIIDWASKIAHSSGAVGMLGGSYLGIGQYLAAGNVGPGSPLKAIFTMVPASDVYRDLIMPGGLFNAAFTPGYVGLAEIGYNWLASPLFAGRDPEGLATTVVQRVGGGLYVPVGAVAVGAVGGETAYDGTFWQERAPVRFFDEVAANEVAVFAYSAWFDVSERGAASQFSGMQNALAGVSQWLPMAPGQQANGKVQIALGPLSHIPAQSQIPWMRLLWFDTWLKGMDTGIEDIETPFHAYEVGGGRWIDAPSWPLPDTWVETYYLGAGPSGSAPHSLNDGRLTSDAPTVGTAADRLPWTGANSPCHRMNDQELLVGPVKGYSDEYGFPENSCTFDDRTAQVGALTYTADALDRDVTVAGPIGVTLYATSTTRNSEWVVTLEDASPDGSSRPLTTGALLGSLREVDPSRSWVVDGRLVAPYHPMTKLGERPVTPGEITRYDIEIPATLARIRAGHRIRITVASSLMPYLMPRADTWSSLVGGIYEVQRTSLYSSHVNIPLVDPGDLQTSPFVWGECHSDCGP